jgi:F-type H+-transporting ATPase subunit gamma
MEMVAASKMRKTQERMQATRPYSRKIAQIIKHLARANPEYKHPFMIDRPVGQAGIILISSDRGLCGGLNANMFRLALRRIRAWHEQGIKVKLATIGQKGTSFFGSVGADILAQKTRLGDRPHLEDILGVIKVMLDAYQIGEIDQLYVLHNDFVNTMTQRPTLVQLLPLQAGELEGEDMRKGHWDYLYEPDAKDVLDQLLIRYVESLVFQGLVENNACEQAARMVAMKSASDNAGKLIKELQLIYNKARQAAITQEIAEIVGGAAAV